MRIRAAAKSDIGRLRERNEDSVLLRDPLFAVADGMGGHRGGNVASALAVEALQEMTDGKAAELLARVKQANVRVLERGQAQSDLRGMGTTLTAVLADGSKGHLVHIGDSRAYLLRDGQLQQLTRDHTLVQRMVDEGRLSPKEAERHPQRSILTRALGVDMDAEPDPLTFDLHAGDRLLLCTDGLTGMVNEDEIQAILQEEADPQAACERLVDAANEAGGEDNITVVVLDVEEDDSPSAETEAVSEATGGAVAPPNGEGVALPNGGAPVQTSGVAGAGVQAPEAPKGSGDVGPAGGPQQRRRRWRRLAIRSAVVVVVLIVAGIGVTIYVNHQWYVGDADGRVAIYKGIPTKVLGVDMSHVQETTELDSAAAERLAPWRDLGDGITASSLTDAESIVDQIRSDLSQTKTGGA
jgi:PPM family protein phosphatase